MTINRLTREDLMKLAVLAGVLVGLTSCGYVAEKQVEHETLINKVRPSIALIGAKTLLGVAHGTGFYMDILGNDVLITNQHVCEIFNMTGAQPFIESFDHAPMHEYKVLKENNQTDLCAIQVTHTPGMTPLVLGTEARYGEDVLILGHPLFTHLLPTFGTLSEEVEDTLHPNNIIMTVNGRIFPGNSGSPVVDMKGNVVGVISEGDNESNIGFMVTYQHLVDFITGIYE